MDVNIPAIFNDLQELINEEHEIREHIKEITKDIEQAGREIVTILQAIHQVGGNKDILESCKLSRQVIADAAKPAFKKLSDMFEPSRGNNYYRFHDTWRFVIQRFVFVIGLIVYLEDETLASRETVGQLLNISTERKDGFYLNIEDYLMGLVQISAELSRLAVNSVTSGDFARPVRISKFLIELNAGFRLLNFRHDVLKKRFDSVQYEVKKVEEVVYDLSVRGLKPQPVPN